MILVTGGTGFLGSILIDLLLQQGVPVRAIRRSTSRLPSLLDNRPGLEWVEADILDFLALEAAFEGVTQVYHCAARVSYHPAHRKAMLRINVEGTAHVVNLCLKHGARLVHVSSIAALGEGKDGEDTTEKDMWEYDRSQSYYSIAKHDSEMEVWRGFSEGLDGVIVNPSLIIGQSAGHKGSGAIFYLLKKGLKYYPCGSVGLVDVEDVARAMIKLMEKKELSEERFIVSNVNLTHKEMLAKSSEFLGRPVPKSKVTPLMLEVAWRLATFMAWTKGKKSTLTKDSARVSSKKLRFSNQKLLQTIDFEFKPIDQTLKEICQRILQQ